MRGVAFLVCLLAAFSSWAAVSLNDRVSLVVALKMSPPCCLVDARSEAARKAQPVKGAVIWSPSLRIKPTSPVVVIADNDLDALATARAIEQRFNAKEVLAVKGGFKTWDAIRAANQGSGMPSSFVIPSNTCEQGKPLQILRSDKP